MATAKAGSLPGHPPVPSCKMLSGRATALSGPSHRSDGVRTSTRVERFRVGWSSAVTSVSAGQTGLMLSLRQSPSALTHSPNFTSQHAASCGRKGSGPEHSHSRMCFRCLCNMQPNSSLASSCICRVLNVCNSANDLISKRFSYIIIVWKYMISFFNLQIKIT